MNENSVGGAAPSLRVSWTRALFRWWCLQRVDALPSGSATTVAVVFGAALLGAWVRIDHWQRQPDPRFAVEGIPLLGWYAVGVLGLAGLLRRSHGEGSQVQASSAQPAFSAALVIALGVVPLPLMLVSVAEYYLSPTGYRWAIVAAALYSVAFLGRGLHTLWGRPRKAAALLGVLFVAAFAFASDAVDAIPDVWNPYEPRDAAAPAEALTAQAETALFEQADRIDAALEPIHRDGSGAMQAFFLGFAGVGDQKVFAQEIGLASRVLGERFHVGERHLSLVNDERDLDRAPLASVTGLQHALQGLAQRMHLERDVLVLAISSHGSQEPSIAVSNSEIPFAALGSDELKQALDESRIEWRIIVISACYAGGFIDPLKNSKTIIITAAAKDRTSFGCSNDRDLTYFGEAFYRDALPEAKSLRAAFEAAKAAIAARERDEHETPSDPQAYFGAEIETKLKER